VLTATKATLLASFLSSVVAASVLAATCGDPVDLIRQETSGTDKYFSAFTFQTNDHGDNILVLIKNEPREGVKPSRWFFMTREAKDAFNFCIVGLGGEFGLLADTHDNASKEEYGMPGSGRPRCSSFASNNSGALPGSIAVRWWANRELGHSTIFYGESPSTSGFQFLISDDHYWIIIEDKNDDPKTSCYYARGDNVQYLFDRHVNAPGNTPAQ
jgi:hypothetical protein